MKKGKALQGVPNGKLDSLDVNGKRMRGIWGEMGMKDEAVHVSAGQSKHI